MAATGDGNGRTDKRTGGARPPTIELTATEVPATGPAGAPGAAKDPAGPHPAEATVSPPAATSKGGPAGPSDGKPTGPAGKPEATAAADKPATAPSPGISGATTGAPASPGPSAPLGSKPAATATAVPPTKPSSETKPAADGKPTDGKTAADAKTTASAKSSTGASSTGASSAGASSTTVPPTAAMPPRRGVGAGGLIAAALIGGVVGLGGALAVTHYGIVPMPRTTDAGADELAARVDALSAAVSAAPASDPDAAAALRQAVSELSTRVDALAAAAIPPTDEAALSARLLALEEQVSAAVPGEGSADAANLQASVTALGDRLNGLTGEVEKLAAAPAAAPAADPAALTALDQRVGALDTQLGERIATVDRTAGEQLAALDDRLDGRLDTLEQQLSTIGEQLTALAGARDAAAAAVAALGERLGTLEATDPAEQARGPAAVAFATLRLGEALDVGRPYAAELAALAPRLEGSADVTALSATAEAGVPTRAALAAMLALEKPAMFAATAPAPAAPAEAGPLDALLSGAQSLVSIRPTSADSGDPVALGLDAVTAALAAGDLAAADTAFAALPEPVRAAAPRFGTGLAQRIAAEAAFARLEATVLARLNGAAE